MSISTSTAGPAIASAAYKYGVPADLLAGVFGHESSFGSAYSAGQTTYGYFGLTSSGLWNPSMSFQQDADTAAQTLKSLYTENGNNWNAAVLKYSNNGYNATQAYATAKGNTSLLDSIAKAALNSGNIPPSGPDLQGPGGVAGGLDSVAAAPGNAYNAAKNAISSVPQAITSVWDSAVSDAKYGAVTLGLLLLGALLIYRAFSSSSGGTKIVPVPV